MQAIILAKCLAKRSAGKNIYFEPHLRMYIGGSEGGENRNFIIRYIIGNSFN